MPLRFFLSPFFLIKHYLTRDIRRLAKEYHFSGDLIDIGCGQKPYRLFFNDITSYQGIDFPDFSINKDFPGSKPDYFFKKSYRQNYRLPFPDHRFDVAVSFQVLEHHPQPTLMIKEMLRITKKNGYLLLSFPLIGGLHEKPDDFQRLTEYGFLNCLKGQKAKVLEIKKQGSLFSTVALLFNEYLNNFAARNRAAYLVSIIIYPPFLLFSYLALFLDRLFVSQEIFINYLVLVLKC
ncbi:MAG: methyltransferase domain-containing protein [Candidatus Pacebacteria bacterium]|nr:methyltransferase domain-containing protein [Candidatus Paceibacterota bacterium]